LNYPVENVTLSNGLGYVTPFPRAWTSGWQHCLSPSRCTSRRSFQMEKEFDGNVWRPLCARAGPQR
jgi:hypothetical protein